MYLWAVVQIYEVTEMWAPLGWREAREQVEIEAGVPGECLQLVVGHSKVMRPVVQEGGEPGRVQEG